MTISSDPFRPPATVRLFLCGDVMTGRGIDQMLPFSCPPRIYERFVTSAETYVTLAERACGPLDRPIAHRDVWGAALEVLESTAIDARIGNLETGITTCEDALPKGINYRMHPGNVPLLAAAGIDCCVLANNHVLDWGETGLLQTLNCLDGAGIAIAGAGSDRERAAAPAILSAGTAGRLLVWGMGVEDSGIPGSWRAGPGPGMNLLPDLSPDTVREIARAVDGIREANDIAIASIHWGVNWGYRIPTGIVASHGR